MFLAIYQICACFMTGNLNEIKIQNTLKPDNNKISKKRERKSEFHRTASPSQLMFTVTSCKLCEYLNTPAARSTPDLF